MGEGWSVPEKNPWITRTDLVASNNKTSHPDTRMHLTLKDVEIEHGQPKRANCYHGTPSLKA